MAEPWDNLNDFIHGIFGGGNKPAPAPVPTVPTAPTTSSFEYGSTSGSNGTNTSYLADLPLFEEIPSRAIAEQAMYGADRALHIWRKRLVNETNKAAGSTLSEFDYLGPGGLDRRYDPDSEYAGSDGTVYMYAGKPITKDEYDERAPQIAKAEATAKNKPKSEMYLAATAAISELESYKNTIKNNLSQYPEDPKDEKPTGGTKGDPYKITPQQFLAGLAMQESSSGPLAGGGGYVPSWASAPLTQGFGPTDEVRDGSYTDPETGEYYPHFNKGYDFGLPEGTPIDAAAGGVVVSANRAGDGWGVSVKIRDAEGNIHNYGHLKGINVAQGQTVKPGDIIGFSGNTADPLPDGTVTSTGPHLSYDVWKESSGKFFEPKKFVAGGGDAGGGYDKVNETTGAYGRYQFLPQYWDWYASTAGYPGADIKDPAMQEAVALYHVTRLLNQYDDPRKVAAIWYMGETNFLNSTPESLAAPQNGGPSVMDYVDGVMGYVANAAKLRNEGIMAPDGTYISVGSGSSGSGGSIYDPLKAKQDKEDRDYELWKRQLGFETSRATEVDRRYDDISGRMDDYLTQTGKANDLWADVANALGNEAKLKELNQSIQDDAIATAANVNAAVNAGKLGYRDALAGPIWSNSLGPIQKELEAVRAALQTAPPGFTDSILATIPKSVPMPYEVTEPLNLPGYTGEYWGTKRYAVGTIPRYANGTPQKPTWREEPDIALYNSGGTLSPQRLAQLRAWGFIDQGTPTTGGTGTAPTPPPGAGTTYKPGYVPRNATLPPDLRVPDDGEWLDAATAKAIMMISSGNAQFAQAWGLGDLAPYAGMPASNFDGGLRVMIQNAVLAHKDDPASVALFGTFPNNPTVWVPDPNAPPAAANPGGAANTRTSGTGFQGNPGQAATYGGVYSGGMDPYDSARIALEKEQLALQKEIARAQQKLDQDRFALEQQQFGSQQEYQAAQIRWNDAKAALDEKNFLLQQTQAQLQERIFEDSVRRYEIETGMARERLDLDKIRQESDMEYQAAQLELARQAGALSQAEYEEKKRQFELTFNYQKEKDQKALDIERAKTTVEYLSNPKDVMRQQFWYASQADPVGTAYDLFTGEDRGQKTYTQAYNEDAEGFMEAMKPYKQYASGSNDNFVHDIAAILGDSAKSNKATGFEEVIVNPTGAPFMVLSNEMSKALGFVPTKGKKFGNHVREGRAS